MSRERLVAHDVFFKFVTVPVSASYSRVRLHHSLLARCAGIFWQLNGFNLTHTKRKILSINPEESDGSRHKSLESFTLIGKSCE